MKTMKMFVALICASILLMGCKTQPGAVNIGPPLVRMGVYTGATYGMIKYPQAIPGVRGAAAIVCAQAAGTNVSPAEVVQAVQAYTELTPESKIIINGALQFYTLLWNTYAPTGTNSVLLGQYLTATCDGLNDALVTGLDLPPMEKARRMNGAALWPQVQ